MHPLRTLITLGCGLCLLASSQSIKADNLTTMVVQGSGANWNGAIWKTNGQGTAVSPVAGNTYECVSNGVAFGASTANTRIRNPANAGVQTFPGDSLTLNENTEIRMKNTGATLNFPGVNGNPGLILKGGIFNAGDDAVFPVTGKILVAAQSYLAPGDNGGGGVKTARGFRIDGQLTGAGNMVIFQAGTNVAQQITGTSNTFSGQWIVKAGRLVGTAPGALGTNSITMDPAYVLPLEGAVMGTITDVPGPAVFEPGYDVNSAGRLTLVNGGILRLHQNCYFTSVSIEGTLLSPGKHNYAELLANYPSNVEGDGSGSITVQPYVNIPPPGILAQPMPTMVLAGSAARFTVNASGTPPLSYRWRKGGVTLNDGGNISGATNATLVISGVTAADVASYDVLVSNAGGSTPSTSASLSLATLSGEAYEAATLALSPVAFYQLNETTDPAAGTAYAFDYAGGYVGTFGAGVQNGATAYNTAGPLPSGGFPGFGAANKAALFTTGTGTSRVNVMPWNLNTNTVTIVAWVNPIGAQTPWEGIVFCRGGGTVAGLNYSGSTDAYANYTLGYTWNNDWETYTWNSGLVPPAGQWSLVALVITPTNATIHVMNAAGLVSSTRSWNHVIQRFSGTTLIGDDSNDGGSGARVFNGTIDNVAIFNTSLSASQLASLYSAGSGVTSFAPVIAAQPQGLNLYAGQTARFTVGAGGSEPLSYQWQVNSSGTFVNVNDDARISGSKTPNLTILNVSATDAGDYVVKVVNNLNSVTSSAATLVVTPTYPAEVIFMTVKQAGGTDWDNAADWSDGLPATDSAAMKPGSTYQLYPGSRMRSPQNPRIATFPGDYLEVQGDGVWIRDPGSAVMSIGEIRFKQPNPGTVFFKKLVMKGGQLDAGNDGIVTVDGQIEIATNAPIYSDSGGDRGYVITAQITGNGTIEYHGYNQGSFMPGYVNNLNIAGNSNTFTGKWNVVIGTLLATGTNALGTNDITVGVNGALEPTYDINNSKGSLFLNGKMYLHQNHTFRSVMLGDLALDPGTYSFSQLSAAYPANFPTAWTPQAGATNFMSGSGSITVLELAPPTILVQPASQSLYVGQTAQFTVSAKGGQPLTYKWYKGATPLDDVGNISGSSTTNLAIASITSADAGSYYVVASNPNGSATSATATLTVLPTSPAENITLSLQQNTGVSWETVTNWSDNLPASVSAVAKPGSTYEVLAGARLRSPDAAAEAVFPGDLLKVDGDGIWVNNPPAGSTLGEIRFKQSGDGKVTFKKLVLNGGQLDTGNDGVVILAGQIDVVANSSFNNNSSNDRGFRVDAKLTGTGTLEYHGYQTAFNPAFQNGLNIAGTANTFSGKWTNAVGLLLGSAPNSLGTNDIGIGIDGALETTYDIKSYQATLVLDGVMYLHQNDWFKQVVIGGVPLAEGKYTFAQLAAAYPANFPATWAPHTGASGYSTGSGSITVLGNSPPPVEEFSLQFKLTGSSLELSWPAGGILLEADSVMGPWRTNNTSSPFTATPTEPSRFYRVLVP